MQASYSEHTMVQSTLKCYDLFISQNLLQFQEEPLNLAVDKRCSSAKTHFVDLVSLLAKLHNAMEFVFSHIPPIYTDIVPIQTYFFTVVRAPAVQSS